jgi:hypothetical protein
MLLASHFIGHMSRCGEKRHLRKKFALFKAVCTNFQSHMYMYMTDHNLANATFR